MMNDGSGGRGYDGQLLAKWMGGKGSGGTVMEWLNNPGIQLLIVLFVPGLVGCSLCVWAFNRLARRYEWRRRLLGR
jgi:hypothetical protein